MTEVPPTEAERAPSRIRRAAVVAVSLLVGFGVLGSIGLYTPVGLRIAERFVQPRLSGVTYEALSGTLAGPVRLVGLRVSTGALSWAVDTVDVAWTPGALLRRRVSIQDVQVRGMQGTRVATDTAGGGAAADAPETKPPPVPVFIDRIDARRIRIPSDEIDVVDAFVVEDIAVDEAARWRSLRLDWAEGEAELSGQVGLLDGPTFDVEGRIDAVFRGERTRARASVSGDFEEVRVALDTELPVALTMGGDVRHVLTEPDVDLLVTLEETEHATLGRVLAAEQLPPPGTVRGTVELTGLSDSIEVDVVAFLELRDYGSVQVSTRALVTDSIAQVPTFSVERSGARIEGRGRVARQTPPSGELNARWSSLSWPLDRPDVTSEGGRLELIGTPDDFALEVDGRWTHRGGIDGALLVAGRGTRTGFEAERFVAELLDGVVTGSFATDWRTVPRWDVAFEARDIQTGPVVPDTATFGGVLSGAGSSWGTLGDDRLDVTIVMDTLVGRVGIADVEASTYTTMSIPRSDDGFLPEEARARFEWLEAVWGPNHLLVSGRVDDVLDAHLTVRAPSLGAVTPRADGEVDALVRLTGTRRAPGAEVVGFGSGLRLDSLTVDTVEVRGEIGARSGEVADGSVRIRTLTLGDRVADSISLRFSGTRSAHEAQVTLAGGPGWVRLRGDGSLDESGWYGSLVEGQTSSVRFGDWTLDGIVDVGAQRDSAGIDQSCWISDEARACLGGVWSPSESRASLAVDGVPLAAVLGSSIEGWAWVGTTSSRLDAVIDSSGVIEMTARLDVDDGHVLVPGGRRFDVPASRATAEIGADGAHTAAEARLVDAAGQEVAAFSARASTEGAIRAGDAWQTLPIEASLVGHIDLPTAVAADLPVDVDSIRGSAQFDLQARGSLDAPRVEGFAEWRDGSFTLPSFATGVSDIDLRAEGSGGDALDIRGTFRMGGPAEVSGRIPLGEAGANRVGLRLIGDSLVVADRSGFEVVAGMEVDAVATPDSIVVTGVVSVNDAVVEADELDAAVVRPSADVVLVDDTSAVVARDTRVDLRVTLGDSVYFSGFGLSGRPSGTINVRGPIDVLVGSGEVALADGTYQAFGQRLDVERGRLLFAGSTVLDPGIDVRASRTATDGVVAGVGVAGTLRMPVLTVFSDPALPEIETLSYIMVGAPWSEATSTESTRITNAAAAEGLRRSNALTSRIAPRLGLSEVRVQADGPLEEASLVAGRQFSSRLYVSYGVGLFQPVSTFRIRYLLSQRWTFLAESGAATGADLLFRIERGR